MDHGGFWSNPGQFTQDHLRKSPQDDLSNPSSLSMASCVEELLVSNALADGPASRSLKADVENALLHRPPSAMMLVSLAACIWM